MKCQEPDRSAIVLPSGTRITGTTERPLSNYNDAIRYFQRAIGMPVKYPTKAVRRTN